MVPERLIKIGNFDDQPVMFFEGKVVPFKQQQEAHQLFIEILSAILNCDLFCNKPITSKPKSTHFKLM